MPVREQLAVAELRVPTAVESPFRAHYCRLILGSALRLAEAELDRLQADGQPWRVRRAERDAATLRGLTGLAALPAPHAHPATREARWFGDSLGRLVGVVWAAAAAFLAVDLVSFGFHSWTTTAADLALIVVTAVWFGVSIDDLLESPAGEPKQLELSE